MKGLCRMIAFLLAVATFILLIVDGTTSVALKAPSWTSTADALARLAGGDIERWRPIVSARLHPLVWSAFETLVQTIPAIFVTLGGAMAFSLLGAKREPDFTMRPPA